MPVSTKVCLYTCLSARYQVGFGTFPQPLANPCRPYSMNAHWDVLWDTEYIRGQSKPICFKEPYLLRHLVSALSEIALCLTVRPRNT